MSGKIRHLVLRPRDGIYCLDGRGWHTSESGRGHALDWPWPSTLRGALLTAWGRKQEREPGASAKSSPDWLKHKLDNDVTLCATLALRRDHEATAWSSEHRVWPTPADALWLEGQEWVFPLLPQKPKLSTLGRDDDAAREKLWVPHLDGKAKPKTAPRWLSEADFIGWLTGKPVPARDSKGFIRLEKRIQAHVGIAAETLTAEESILFQHDVRETLEEKAEWAIGAAVTTKDDKDFLDTVTLGSDGRLARIEEGVPAELFDPPKDLLAAFGKSAGLRLVAVTPARFQGGWLPDGFIAESDGIYRGELPHVGRVILRATFVPRPAHISGWDMANGKPKATDRMVPPGAVYFFERESKEPISRDEARQLWLAAWGGRQEEGFGRFVPGTWDPKETMRHD